MSEEKKPEHKRRSHAEARAARTDDYAEKAQAKKVSDALKRRKEQLNKATKKFRKQRKKDRSSPVGANKLKTYDAVVAYQEREMDKEIAVGASMKITPDIERVLFPYFTSGASIRSIHQQFGQKFSFGLQALYTARDVYKWEQRRKAILQVVRNDSDLHMAERFKDYQAFFDDIMSEAIIRFQQNSALGKNSNPFEGLKITNIKDMKDLMEMMITLRHGGIKKIEVENKGEVTFSTKKQSKLLEVLAEDDEEEG